jgi:hypothetical protein
MARVWQRIGRAVFFGVLVAGLWDCKGLSLKQKPGDKCTHNNMYVCTDPSEAILCQDGTLVAMPCHGPKGCQGTGTASQCDDDLAKEGDSCVVAASGANYSCGTELKSELICTAGKFVLASTCKGPKGCRIVNANVECDHNFAEVGDTCVAPASDSNYSCTPDKKTEVVCQENKFAAWQPCKGPKGCHNENNSVYCDATFGADGDTCRHVDANACTEDAKSMLKCSPQFKWAKQKDCPKEGCKLQGNQVWCK